jgi:hypothetical protein
VLAASLISFIVLLSPVQPDRENEKGPHDFVQTLQIGSNYT